MSASVPPLSGIPTSSEYSFGRFVITPEIAQLILNQPFKNRSIRPSFVNNYTRDMEGHRFCPDTHHAILFSKPGLTVHDTFYPGPMLLDGQNRLTACVRSQTAFTTLVVWGVDFSVQQYVDAGSARSTRDVLHLRDGAVPDTLVTSLASMIWVRGRRKLGVGQVQTRSRQEQVAVVDLYADGIEWLISVIRHRKAPYIKRGDVLAEVVRAWYSMPERAYEIERLVDRLITMLGFTMGDPMLHLRKKLIDDHAVLTSQQRSDYVALCLRLALDGKSISRIGRQRRIPRFLHVPGDDVGLEAWYLRDEKVGKAQIYTQSLIDDHSKAL